MTLHARMAVMNYAWFGSLLPKDIPVPQINYNMNLLNTVIGGVNLALCNGGANECIKSNDTRVLHYNRYRRRVSISVAGDHQLTGARLCTRMLIAKTNQGWNKLI